MTLPSAALLAGPYRRTPTGLSFFAPSGHGNAAVSLAITIQYRTIPGDPCFVSVPQLLPNGSINIFPTDPCAPQLFANEPLHDFVPAGDLRGFLESASVNSSVFIVPPGGGDF